MKKRKGGFSLIEMVGVLAIISILAALIIPRVISQYDRAAWVRETGDQAGISNALVMAILTSKRIPSSNPDDWSTSVASQMPLPPGSITNTPRRVARYLMTDPLFFTNLPCSLGLAGSGSPRNARMMILSTISIPLTSSDSTSGNFNTIWSTDEGTKPSTWTWAGSGEDLRIQRINLEPLFHRLKLVNESPQYVGMFSMDGSSPANAPVGGAGWDCYYLDGTLVGLCDTNGTNMASQILKCDMGFVFERGIWKAQMESGIGSPPSLGQLYGYQVANFLATDVPKTATVGVSPDYSVVLINQFMSLYTAWANDNPCFAIYRMSPTPEQTAIWQMLTNTFVAITNTTGGLLQ